MKTTEKNSIKYGNIKLYNILAESYFTQEKMDSAYFYSIKALRTSKEFSLNREITSKRLKKVEQSQMLLLNKKINERRENTKNTLSKLIAFSIILFLGFVFYLIYLKRLE